SAGAAERPGAGLVNATELDVDFPAVARGRGVAEVEGIVAGGGDVDRVLEPLPRLHPADVVSTAGIGGGLEIDASRAVSAAIVTRVEIVEGDPLAAVVEVFCLDRGCRRADRERRAAKSGLRRRR